MSGFVWSEIRTKDKHSAIVVLICHRRRPAQRVFLSGVFGFYTTINVVACQVGIIVALAGELVCLCVARDFAYRRDD